MPAFNVLNRQDSLLWVVLSRNRGKVFAVDLTIAHADQS
jgi:hypothetical protein